MGNYKKRKVNEESDVNYSSPFIVLLCISIGMLVGSVFSKGREGILIGIVASIPLCIWLDGAELKKSRAQKNAAKIAAQKEEERRAKIREQRKNK